MMAQLLLKGWTMTDVTCVADECGVAPLMRTRDKSVYLCVACGGEFDQEGTPLKAVEVAVTKAAPVKAAATAAPAKATNPTSLPTSDSLAASLANLEAALLSLTADAAACPTNPATWTAIQACIASLQALSTLQ